MSKKILMVAFLLIAHCSVFIVSYAQEQMTITTYYPSPFGSYNELTVANRQAIGNVDGSADGKVDTNDLAVDAANSPIPGSLTVASNVGIGTRTPGAKLHIFDPQAVELIVEGDRPEISETNHPQIKLLQDTGRIDATITFGGPYPVGMENTLRIMAHDLPGTNQIGGIIFGTGETGGIENEHLTILPNGNVGIGTTNPASRLQISGDIVNNFPRPLYVQGSSGGVHTAAFVNPQNYGVAIGGIDGLQYGTIQASQFVNGSGPAMADLILNELGGNVGIGTVTPTEKLHVVGNIIVDTNNYLGGNFYNSFQPGHGDGDSFLNSSQDWVLSIDSNNNDATNNHKFVIYKNAMNGAGTELFRVLENGNVGIGTTSPGSRLHVKGGDIRVENGSFIDDGTTLIVPDYVFEPEYNLKSLLEVERFVLKHKHLEGLPGLGDTGGWAALSIQDRDMKLLEKTEELMLYVIEQQKRVEELEQRLSKLEGR